MSRAIMHIPHSSLLEWHTVKHWGTIFEDMSGRTPTDIALPAVGFNGPNFPSQVRKPSSGDNLEDWLEDARAAVDGVFVWAVVNASFPFVANPMELLRDQFQNHLPDNACISRPAVQMMADTLIGEIIELGFDGIALDVTDIYPQSTTRGKAGGRLGLQHTCFCQHCVAALDAEGYYDGATPFMGRRNPFRIVLDPTETGVDNITIDLRESLAHPDVLLEQSMNRGFANEDDLDARTDLETLLRYLPARAGVVAKSIRRLVQEAKHPGNEKRVAVMLADSNVDLTTMTDLDTLVSVGTADEYWSPEVNTDMVREGGVVVNQYLVRGGAYSVNPMFEWVDDAHYTVNARGLELWGEAFGQRYRKLLLANVLTRAAVVGCDGEPALQGFVGVPLREADLKGLAPRLLAVAQKLVQSDDSESDEE